MRDQLADISEFFKLVRDYHRTYSETLEKFVRTIAREAIIVKLEAFGGIIGLVQKLCDHGFIENAAHVTSLELALKNPAFLPYFLGTEIKFNAKSFIQGEAVDNAVLWLQFVFNILINELNEAPDPLPETNDSPDSESLGNTLSSFFSFRSPTK